MHEGESAEPTDSKQTEDRSRFSVARAVLLGALSLGSLVGGEAAASADPSPLTPIIGGYTATCEYSFNAGTARPIVAATEGVGDDEQEAIEDAREKVPGRPLSVRCHIDDQDQPDVATAFNAARGQNDDDDDSNSTGGSYHLRHNNPGR